VGLESSNGGFCREGRRQTILGTDRLDLSWLEHEAIHAAIKRAAPSRAQAAMLRHLEHTEERVQRLLQSSAATGTALTKEGNPPG